MDQLNALELQAKMVADSTLFIIDVRTPGEYQHDGHIPGSRLVPLSVLPVRMQEIPKDRTIVCVCRSGARSYTACELLQKKGYQNVYNLSGGMIGWKRAGLRQQ
jgi:rhodanese-related sulfurtransferase